MSDAAPPPCAHEWSESYVCTLCAAVKYDSAPTWATTAKLASAPRAVLLAMWACARRHTHNPPAVYPGNAWLREHTGGMAESTIQGHLRTLQRLGWIARTDETRRSFFLAWRKPYPPGSRTLTPETHTPRKPTATPQDPSVDPQDPTGHPPETHTLNLQGLGIELPENLDAAAREEPDPHGHTPADPRTQAPPSSSTASYTPRDPRQDIERDRAGVRSPPDGLAEGLDADAAGDPALPGSTAGRVANDGRPAHVEAVPARALRAPTDPDPTGRGMLITGRPGTQPRRGGGDYPGSGGRLSQKLTEAVAAAGDVWGVQLGHETFEKLVRETVDDLGLTPEELTKGLLGWDKADRRSRPPRHEWLYGRNRRKFKAAAGLGETKPARKSGALPMDGGGGKTNPRRVRAFENKATYDARIAREAAAS